MARYWELVNPGMLDVFLKMLWDLAFDLASPTTRHAVLMGVNHLLDECVLSYDYLKDRLVELSPLLHDTSERVRVEFVEVLLRISRIKLIRFYDVVPIEDLLNRLVIDSSAQVRKRISRLLLPSYFPEHREVGIQIERCQFMLEANVEAARVFYAFMPELVENIQASAAFAVSLYEFLHFALVEDKKPRLEDEATETDELRLLASNHFEGFLEVVAICLVRLFERLQPGKESHESLKESIEMEICSRPLRLLNEFSHTDRARCAVMSIAKILRPDRARKQGIEEHVAFNKKGDATLVVVTMMSAGRLDELFDAIVKQIVSSELGNTVRQVQEAEKKQRGHRMSQRETVKRKKEAFAYDDEDVWAEYCDFETDGTDVFQVLESVLREEDLRVKFLGDAERVSTVSASLNRSVDLLDQVLQEGGLDDRERRRKCHFLAKAVEMAVRFTLHYVCDLEDGSEFLARVIDPLLTVISTSLSKRVDEEAKDDRKQKKNERQARAEALLVVVNACLTTSVEAVALGFASVDYRTRLLQAGKELLALQNDTMHLEAFAKILNHVADNADVEDDSNVMTQFALDLLLLVHNRSVGELKRREGLRVLKPVLSGVVRSLIFSGKLSSIAKPLVHLAVHDQLSSVIDDDVLVRVPELSRFICALFAKPKSLQDAFMEELKHHGEENCRGHGDEGDLSSEEEVEVIHGQRKRAKGRAKRMVKGVMLRSLDVQDLQVREVSEYKRVCVVKRVVDIYDWIASQVKDGMARSVLSDWIDDVQQQSGDEFPGEVVRFLAARRQGDAGIVPLPLDETEEEAKLAEASFM